MYLRQFKKLSLVNLAGNPITTSPDYRSYVLSHIKDLTYLDYRRVNAADVAAAIEQHQVGILMTFLSHRTALLYLWTKIIFCNTCACVADV